MTGDWKLETFVAKRRTHRGGGNLKFETCNWILDAGERPDFRLSIYDLRTDNNSRKPIAVLSTPTNNGEMEAEHFGRLNTTPVKAGTCSLRQAQVTSSRRLSLSKPVPTSKGRQPKGRIFEFRLTINDLRTDNFRSEAKNPPWRGEFGCWMLENRINYESFNYELRMPIAKSQQPTNNSIT